MVQFNVSAEETIVEEFRLEVGKIKGAKKGALSEAINEALRMWIETKKLEKMEDIERGRKN